MTARSALLVLAILLTVATSAIAQDTPPSLAGRWQVLHLDRVLGPVQGVARIDKDERSATVVLTHPQTNAEHSLTAVEITRTERGARIVLDGYWPGAEGYQLAPLGKPVRAPAAELTVRLGRNSGDLRVLPSQPADLNRVTLELTFSSPDALRGTWRYRADADTGRDRAGGGRIGDFAFATDGSGTATQSGVEYWTRPRPQIYAAVPIVDQLAAPYGNVRWPYPYLQGGGRTNAADARRLLLVVGKELPTVPADPLALVSLTPNVTYLPHALRRELREDPQFRRERDLGLEKLKDALSPEQYAEVEKLDMLLVAASLAPGVRPGLTGFTLNGAEGTWLLQFGDYTGTLDVVRELGPTSFEATDFVFRPEFIRLEVRADRDLPYQQIPLLLGRNGQITLLAGQRTIPARQVPGEPRVYRTEPIALVDPRVTLPLGPLPLPVQAGDVVTATLGELGLVHLRPGQARARVLISPDDVTAAVLSSPTSRGLIWKEALTRAARCAGQPPQDWDKLARQEADALWNLMIFTSGRHIRSTTVTLADHAAMLMLRATFLEMMTAEADQYASLLDSDEKLLGFRKQFEPFAFRDDVALAGVRVDAPTGATVRLATSYLPELLEEQYGLEGEAADRWILAATRQAIERYLVDIRHSMDKATAVSECDVEDLLELTGFGFNAVVRQLKPRLMQITQIGTPPRLLWQPDRLARDRVLKLGLLAESVRIQRDLGKIDTQMFLLGLSMAALPFTLVVHPVTAAYIALAVDLADFGVTIVHEVPGLVATRAEVKFARGAAAVLGLDRLREAELRETEQWFNGAVAILGTGLAAKASGFTTWRTVTQRRAVERGKRLLENTRAADIPSLPKAARQDALAAIEEVRHLERRVGREALDAAETAVLRVSDQFEETWRLSRTQKPGWARRLSDADFARIEELRLRPDVARLVERNPAAMARLVGDNDALDVLRGAPFESLAQLEEAIKEAKRRIKVPLGEPFYRSTQPRAPAGARELVSEGLHIQDSLRTPYGRPRYEGTVYFGADQAEVGGVVRALEADHRRGGQLTATFEFLGLRSHPTVVPPSMIRIAGPLQLTDRGTPLAMFLNLRALNALGVQYADPRLAVVKLSTVVNGNTAIQLHWMERVYGAQNVNRYARFTHSVLYAEGALTQAGFRIKSVEVRGGGIQGLARGMLDGDFYDGRVPAADFLRRYDVAPDEIVRSGHDIYVFVEPIK